MPAAAAAAWDALRRLPEAALLGLALPRFLLRPPYGSDTSSIDRFEFEEFGREAGKKPYLWGNGALACAALLAQSFHKQGWAFRPGAALDLTDLPMHVGTDEDGDSVATVAETWVDRRLAEPLGRQGFMCLLGVRGVNALQLARFQSLALPPADQTVQRFMGAVGPGRRRPVGQHGAAVLDVGRVQRQTRSRRRLPPPSRRPRRHPRRRRRLRDAADAADAGFGLADCRTWNSLRPPHRPPPRRAAAAPPEEEADAELDALLKELGGDIVSRAKGLGPAAEPYEPMATECLD